MRIVLLSRRGCSACAAARADLARIRDEVGEGFDEVDVDERAGAGDPELRVEYGDRLPVVLLDGVEHSYWAVDDRRLRADLAP
ncbi:hypothetical protein GCM10010528_30850 [Gordonia defluvii]|jgi:glutaredoxin|uniref:Glutaredoxin family protein n=1 Tax=Gordonia defluvii TaxID=283718 RepID=A0ABP6LPL1_9ACTN|nr:glutaredoxin family protein [Gordonia sp. UBA5067]